MFYKNDESIIFTHLYEKKLRTINLIKLYIKFKINILFSWNLNDKINLKTLHLKLMHNHSWRNQ